MWEMDSYREILREHKKGHHAIGSAFVLLAVICLLVLIFP